MVWSYGLAVHDVLLGVLCLFSLFCMHMFDHGKNIETLTFIVHWLLLNPDSNQKFFVWINHLDPLAQHSYDLILSRPAFYCPPQASPTHISIHFRMD